jgi:hypothetical protein
MDKAQKIFPATMLKADKGKTQRIEKLVTPADVTVLFVTHVLR